MPDIAVGDMTMHYEIVGAGPPLVMIMGFTASLECWGKKLIERLSNDFTLLLFDNRGAGRTTAGVLPFSISQFAVDTANLMDVLGWDKASVMGSSMGGMVAQEFALAFPQKTDRLILCCTEPGGIHTRLPRLKTLLALAKPYGTQADRVRGTIWTIYPKKWLDEHPEAVDEEIAMSSIAPISAESTRRQIKAIVFHNTFKRLPGLRKETLVVCGDQDVLIPPANSRTLAGRIPGARLRSVEGGGHAFPIQYPDLVAGIVSDFLLGRESSSTDAFATT